MRPYLTKMDFKVVFNRETFLHFWTQIKSAAFFLHGRLKKRFPTFWWSLFLSFSSLNYILLLCKSIRNKVSQFFLNWPRIIQIPKIWIYNGHLKMKKLSSPLKNHSLSYLFSLKSVGLSSLFSYSFDSIVHTHLHAFIYMRYLCTFIQICSYLLE